MFFFLPLKPNERVENGLIYFLFDKFIGFAMAKEDRGRNTVPISFRTMGIPELRTKERRVFCRIFVANPRTLFPHLFFLSISVLFVVFVFYFSSWASKRIYE